MKAQVKILAMIFLFSAHSGCNDLYVEEPKVDPVAIFENLWSTFESEYAVFEERNVDWNNEYSKHRPLVSSHMTDDQLHEVLTKLLLPLNDGHVYLTAPGREVFFSNEIRRQKTGIKLFDLEIIKENYLEAESGKEVDESYIYGKVKNKNIGYIHFNHIGENFLELNTFLTKFETAEGIIIDLRHNSGGDFTWSFSNLGRLTPVKKYVFRSKTKNGEGENDYTSWKEWYIEPHGQYVNKPLAVLTDRYTISAAERTVMAFKALSAATLIGDTTNGAHGTMIGRELANGWFYSLVPQKVEMYDGKSYEGIGLSPDIRIINSPSELSMGIDNTLDAAIKLLQ